jgi:AraC family transcriptional regulator, transcriptional activator of pobA
MMQTLVFMVVSSGLDEGCAVVRCRAVCRGEGEFGMAACIQNLYDSNMREHNGILLAQGLFGESAQLPDVMHCETIAARSSLHGWELAPHRHGKLHQVLLLRLGCGAAHLEGRKLALEAMSLVNVPSGDVHAFAFEPGTQGFVVTLAEEMLDTMLEGVGDVRRLLGRSFVVQANPQVDAVMQQIWQEFSGLAEARALVLRGLGATLLGLAARLAQEGAAVEASEAELAQMQRFEALIEAHYLEHWRVADYAKALGMSPTHLSRIARAATGEPASRLIDARVIREARRNLAYTSLGVSTIAYALGFADPAHFSRVFSRATGLSPRAFRQGVAH